MCILQLWQVKQIWRCCDDGVYGDSTWMYYVASVTELNIRNKRVSGKQDLVWQM